MHWDEVDDFGCLPPEPNAVRVGTHVSLRPSVLSPQLQRLVELNAHLRGTERKEISEWRNGFVSCVYFLFVRLVCVLFSRIRKISFIWSIEKII